MQLRGLEYSGPFMCATEKYLPLITPTLFSCELSHWGAELWNPRQMLRAVRPRKPWAQLGRPKNGVHPAPNRMARRERLLPRCPVSCSRYRPKKRKEKAMDNMQPTACELPWLQRKGAWTPLRSCACYTDVAPLLDSNRTRSSSSCCSSNNRPLSNLTAHFIQLRRMRCLWPHRIMGSKQALFLFGGLFSGRHDAAQCGAERTGYDGARR